MDIVSDHIIYLNYGIRIIIFAFVLFWAIKKRNILVMVMAVSYALSLILVMLDAPRLLSLVVGTLSASLTAWYIIKSLSRERI